VKIAGILKKKMTFSFEVFPPKEDEGVPKLRDELKELFRFSPDFISCTYGAGGTNIGKSKETCKLITDSKVTCMTHFTCIGNTKKEIKETVRNYIGMGVENVLAMRGDFPKDGATGKLKTTTGGDFEHANFLIEYLRRLFPKLGIACAGYPEKHILAPSIESDIAFLKAKQDAGAEFVMLQLCHDVDAYCRFRDKCRKAGIHIPLVTGLMPVLARDPIINMTVANGCSIPPDLAAIIGTYAPERGVKETASDFKKAGMEYTVKKLWQYMAAGAEGIHIYALNKSADIAQIVLDAGIRAQSPAAQGI
jgi:methylenetetrahydrofolate reductase (NADPH)